MSARFFFTLMLVLSILSPICANSAIITHGTDGQNTQISAEEWNDGDIHVVLGDLEVSNVNWNLRWLHINEGAVVAFNGPYRIYLDPTLEWTPGVLLIEGAANNPAIFANAHYVNEVLDGGLNEGEYDFDYNGGWKYIGIYNPSSITVAHAEFHNCMGSSSRNNEQYYSGVLQLGDYNAAMRRTSDLFVNISDVTIDFQEGAQFGHGINIFPFYPVDENSTNHTRLSIEDVTINGTSVQGTRGIFLRMRALPGDEETRFMRWGGSISNVTVNDFDIGLETEEYTRIGYEGGEGWHGLVVHDCVVGGDPEMSTAGIALNGEFNGPRKTHLIHNCNIRGSLYGINYDAVSDIPGATLIRNNIIQEIGVGILVGHELTWEEPQYLLRKPSIYNNAISLYNNQRAERNAGIEIFRNPDIEGFDPDRMMEVCNNTIWGENIEQYGMIMHWDQSDYETWIWNNIIGQNGDEQITGSAILYPDVGNIIPLVAMRHNAFARNHLNICTINYQEIGEAEETRNVFETFHLVNENPSPNSWNFRLVVLGFLPVKWVAPNWIYQFDNDCILSEDAYDDDDNDSVFGDWAIFPTDFDWQEDGSGNDESCADIGAFGGKYADQFTQYGNTHYISIPPECDDVGDRHVEEPRDDYYHIEKLFHVSVNGRFRVVGGRMMFAQAAGIECSGEIELQDGDNEPLVMTAIDVGFPWAGISITSTTSVDSSWIGPCIISNAVYGIQTSGVTNTLGHRFPVLNTTISDCGVGVYANNSRLKLDSCSITGSYASATYGSGVYLTNCGSGKVVIDGCTIEGNGTGSTVSSSGLYLSSSSPQVINSEITGNSGGGIYCSSSSPDLNTDSTSGACHNSIYENGGVVQSGSNGAEIYLTSSYPTIRYNNIYDGGGSPLGYMIYKYNGSSSVTATNNWWGTSSPTSSYFYVGGTGAVVWSPYASSGYGTVSAEEFDYAMELWNEGEYAEAAGHFRNCVSDSGAVGINSVHYLAGCVAMVENPDYDGLRDFLQDAAAEHQDPAVAKTALRFATDCLTQQGHYDDAMSEYDARRANAGCLEDSVLAVVDYLSVYELANGGNIDAAVGDVPSKMSKLLASLDGERNGGSKTLPTEVSLAGCYPNPFNAVTKIEFGLPEASWVSVRVFDITGREVATLMSGELQAGNHLAVWNAEGFDSGVYLVKMEAKGGSQVRKVTLVR